MRAIDPVLADAAELARVVAHAHQGGVPHLVGEGWADASLVRLAALTSAALDALARVHLVAHPTTPRQQGTDPTRDRQTGKEIRSTSTPTIDEHAGGAPSSRPTSSRSPGS